MIRAISACALAALALVCGCRGTGDADTGPIVRTEPPPAYEIVAAAHNERVELLGRLWSRAVVQVRYEDEEGDRNKEQGEGHLQVERPDRLALTAGKFGETYVHLGCNEQRYWWFDLTDGKRVWVGSHDPASHTGRDELVVSPRDLIALLGVLPLPESGEVAWSHDGRTIRVDIPAGGMPTMGAGLRMWFRPDTLEPKWIAITDAGGWELFVSELDRYDNIPVEGMGATGPRGPKHFYVWNDEDTSELRIILHDPVNKPLRDLPFSFDTLLEAYGVEEINDLDEADEPS
jgi:hypothetical protein